MLYSTTEELYSVKNKIENETNLTNRTPKLT